MVYCKRLILCISSKKTIWLRLLLFLFTVKIISNNGKNISFVATCNSIHFHFKKTIIMSQYTLKGTIHKILDLETKGGYNSRKFVVFVPNEKNSKYNDYITFQLGGAHCDIIENHSVGNEVEVTFNLQGREWLNPKTNEMNYFGTNSAWKIQLIGGQTQTATQQAPPPQPILDNNGDDLPF